MTREDRLLDLFARANPEPDPDRLEAELRDPVHLTTLGQWSEDMTGTELRTIEPRTKNPRGPWPVDLRCGRWTSGCARRGRAHRDDHRGRGCLAPACGARDDHGRADNGAGDDPGSSV